MEESPQILRFNEIPSPEEFTSLIEPKNVPAVFNGCVKNWKAISKWDVSKGGLEYLQELVGSSAVEAMLSRSAPVFYGDIRSHERVLLPFSTFVGYCKDLLRYGDEGHDSSSELKKHQLVGLATQPGDTLIVEEAPQQIYLAQAKSMRDRVEPNSNDSELTEAWLVRADEVPILNTENEEKVQLECLSEDIETPAFLKGKKLASVNLWMNNAGTRSSTHYDPHHNLLCIICGSKEVVLWPPSATPFLYPLPLYGEASNHSAISLENPDFHAYPRATCLGEYSQKVILHAGDALFIPEGWFHQVDSGNVTIAVNFWWRSEMVSGMLEHMDAYYMRRILKRLTDKETNQILRVRSTRVDTTVMNASSQSCHGHADYHDEESNLNHQTAKLIGEKPDQRFRLHDLEPNALQSLQELVSLVHNCVNLNQPIGNTSTDPSVTGEGVEVRKMAKTSLFKLEEDPIANIIWTLESDTFQKVFLTMAHNFPRTLEALVLHALSPIGAEVLTRKFEQMDQLTSSDDQSQFYQKFYSVFDDQSVAMDVILNGKESFARQAFKNVLVQYLGVNFDGPKPLVE